MRYTFLIVFVLFSNSLWAEPLSDKDIDLFVSQAENKDVSLSWIALVRRVSRVANDSQRLERNEALAANRIMRHWLNKGKDLQVRATLDKALISGGYSSPDQWAEVFDQILHLIGTTPRTFGVMNKDEATQLGFTENESLITYLANDSHSLSNRNKVENLLVQYIDQLGVDPINIPIVIRRHDELESAFNAFDWRADVTGVPADGELSNEAIDRFLQIPSPMFINMDRVLSLLDYESKEYRERSALIGGRHDGRGGAVRAGLDHERFLAIATTIANEIEHQSPEIFAYETDRILSVFETLRALQREATERNWYPNLKIDENIFEYMESNAISDAVREKMRKNIFGACRAGCLDIADLEVIEKRYQEIFEFIKSH